jgi:hypothetical protein
MISGGRSVENEILFEKIKALPKRSQYYGIHRKLSWQCQKEILQSERDFWLFNKEYVRSEAKMRGRLENLKRRKRELIDSGAHSSVLLRHTRQKKNANIHQTWRFETNLEDSKLIDILVVGEEKCDNTMKPMMRREQTICVKPSTSGARDKAQGKIRSLSSIAKNKQQQSPDPLS